MTDLLLSALIFAPLLGAAAILLQSEEAAIWRSAFIFALMGINLSGGGGGNSDSSSSGSGGFSGGGGSFGGGGASGQW